MAHIPVLLQEVIEQLDPKPGMTVVDGTAGAGGHAHELCARIGKTGTIVLIDRDAQALERTRARLADLPCQKIFIQGDYKDMDAYAKEYGFEHPSAVLLDLGVSSHQIDDSGRGFSFLRDEPLLMTMKESPTDSDITAADVVNTWSEENLADIIYGFGEERYSRRIARALVARRAEKPFTTTLDLVEVIRQAVPSLYRRGKIHPATKTFQAIRIAVNTELSSLESAIQSAWNILAPGGRAAFISFHSLEDRILKRGLHQFEKEEQGKRITKKPIIPTVEEIKSNPRSRSAKLRVIEKNI